jgi:hypothetical protein
MIKITHLTNISFNSHCHGNDGLAKSPDTHFYKWQHYYFKLDSQLLNNNLISESLKLL